jgi:uncharacterized membrane protein
MNVHQKRAFIIIPVVTLFLLIIYALLQFWILPTYVSPDKQTLASSSTNYALTIATALVGLGTYLARYLDLKDFA